MDEVTSYSYPCDPNRTLRELLYCVETCPHQVLANPALPLLALEDPELCARVIYEAKLVLLDELDTRYLPDVVRGRTGYTIHDDDSSDAGYGPLWTNAFGDGDGNDLRADGGGSLCDEAWWDHGVWNHVNGEHLFSFHEQPTYSAEGFE